MGWGGRHPGHRVRHVTYVYKQRVTSWERESSSKAATGAVTAAPIEIRAVTTDAVVVITEIEGSRDYPAASCCCCCCSTPAAPHVPAAPRQCKAGGAVGGTQATATTHKDKEEEDTCQGGSVVCTHRCCSVTRTAPLRRLWCLVYWGGGHLADDTRPQRVGAVEARGVEGGDNHAREHHPAIVNPHCLVLRRTGCAPSTHDLLPPPPPCPHHLYGARLPPRRHGCPT